MSHTIKFNIVVQFLFVFSLFLGCVHKAEAFDDFFDTNLDKWNVSLNSGIVQIGDGILHIESNPGISYPYLYLRGDEFNKDSYTFEIKFRISGNLNYGSGIVLSETLLTNGTFSDMSSNDYIFAAWPTRDNTFLIATTLCPNDNNPCSPNNYTNIIFESLGTWHTWRITKSNNQYDVYLDGTLVYSSGSTSRAIKYLWLGNPQQTGGVVWPNIDIDYASITDNTVVPPINISPVIIIPGLGASWDYPSILIGTPGFAWHVPAFVGVYDNLINSLTAAGYEKDKNLFIYAYDWRKTMDKLGDDFNAYLQKLTSENKIKATDKVNLVGHSMGGLVARSFAQTYGTSNINKIVTLGTPHTGAVDAYGTWEGAEAWNWQWWQRSGLELILKLNSLPAEPKVTALRRIIPSIQDLLPVYDYVYRNNVAKPWNSMNQVNQRLFGFNQNISSIDSLLFAWGGENRPTKNKIYVTDRSWAEKQNKMWEDGKPLPNNPFNAITEGDGTVLLASALGSFSSNGKIDASHIEVAGNYESIKAVFGQLGLDETKIVTTTPPDTRENIFVVALRSPGFLKVCNLANVCNENLGVYVQDQKLFMLPDPTEADYKVEVVSNGEAGKYKLYFGKLFDNETKWFTFYGNINGSAETDTFNVKSLLGGYRVTTDISGSRDNLLEIYIKLLALSPNWDKPHSIDKVLDSSLTKEKRYQAIHLARVMLSNLIDLDQKKHGTEVTETAIELWGALDRMVEVLLANSNKTSIKDLDNMRRVSLLTKKLIINQLARGDSYFSSVLYANSEDLVSMSDQFKSTQRDIAKDKMMSAEGLLLTALRIR